MIKKHPNNPILSKKDVPYDSELVFNAGFTKFRGKYVAAFRNDYGSNKHDWDKHFQAYSEYPPKSITPLPRLNTLIGFAFSDDGINWEVQPKLRFELKTEGITNAYDPRLTVINDIVYICFATGTPWGVRGGIAATDDFEKFEILHMTVPDNRNMVMFPEKINDKFFRLERPFPVYGKREYEMFDIWISSSKDCVYWGEHKLLLGAENVPYANSKIGPGAPPIKTEKGWLTTFHAVQKVDREIYAWHPKWHKIYYAGLMLLDLEDPSKIIGICDEPIIKPEEKYELEGFRGEVIFPSGMILEDLGEVKIYYGAADTVECLATAHVDDLLKLCKAP